MRPIWFLAALFLLAPAGEAWAQQSAPAGTLIIIGGALRFDNADVWSRIVRHASEAQTQAVSTAETPRYRPRIAVFPTASGNPQRAGEIAAEILTNYGADPFIVPVGIRGMEMDAQTAVHDAGLVERVKGADGVYFTGGSQARITDALRMPDGGETPLLQAVREVYQRGGAIAGTSAGAAIMSRIMYREARHVLPTLQNGVAMGKEVDHGLGFLDPSWFVEQHTLVRGRFARALVAMASQNIQYGVGVDENTAIVVKNDSMEVVGYKGAIVMDVSEAAQDPAVEGFNLKNVKLTYLDDGDSLCLSTREVTPSSKKQEGDKLDPKSPDYKPETSERLFTADILGNTTAVDMMCKLMRHTVGEAVGLAFDGGEALHGTAKGFEFRFYRGDDTVGWCCSSRGDECYTVRNVHLDIRPIEIVGPLYR